MLRNDNWIKEQAIDQEMISPFTENLIRKTDYPVLSFGTSSYGYDAQLSEVDFKVFKSHMGREIDPKSFDENFLEKTPLMRSDRGNYFVLPAKTYGMGVTVEKFKIPSNATAICVGKSTNARCGIFVNCTPLESSWSGHITLEFFNGASAPVRLYCEGALQILFFTGEPCRTTYSQRNGKYQNQPHQIVPPRI